MNEKLAHLKARHAVANAAVHLHNNTAWKSMVDRLKAVRHGAMRDLAYGSVSPPRVARNQGLVAALDAVIDFERNATADAVESMAREIKAMEHAAQELQHLELDKPPGYFDRKVREMIRQEEASP